MLERLAHVIARRRRWVIAVWIVLTLVGAFSAGQLSKRWFQSFSIPGYSGYETNQKTLKLFGSGEFPPMVAVFHSNGDITKVAGIEKAIDAASSLTHPRVSSVLVDRQPRVRVRGRPHRLRGALPAREPGFHERPPHQGDRAKLKAATPAGVQSYLTGRDPLLFATESANGPSVLTETLIGGIGALIILFFVFGTMPAVLMPIAMAIASILNTFTLVYLLTYVTHVSIIVQYLIALVGLGVAIDYALLMIFRFRDELREGEDVETALVQTMTHAGRSVIMSGSTVAVGLLSMVVLPLPFIRSIGIGGMLIPLVSVIAAITLLPAIMVSLGPNVNRFRLLPKRFVDKGHPEDGPWGRWADIVTKHPWPVGLAGLLIVGLLVFEGVQTQPERGAAQVLPGERRRDRRAAGAGRRGHLGRRDEADRGARVARREDGRRWWPKLGATAGIAGVAAPPAWQKSGYSLIEAFPNVDSSSKQAKTILSSVRES